MSSIAGTVRCYPVLEHSVESEKKIQLFVPFSDIPRRLAELPQQVTEIRRPSTKHVDTGSVQVLRVTGTASSPSKALITAL